MRLQDVANREEQRQQHRAELILSRLSRTPTQACTCFHNVRLNMHVDDALASAEVTAETETQISDSVYWKHEPQRILTD